MEEGAYLYEWQVDNDVPLKQTCSDIMIYGFNDQSSEVPDFFKQIEEVGWKACFEIPNVALLLDYLNNKSTYQLEIKEFIQGFNGVSLSHINESLLKAVYLLGLKFDSCCLVGCTADSRFERSVQMTRNLLSENLSGKIKIFVGEPHRLFIEHFLKKKYCPDSVSSESHTPFKTSPETSFVIGDIRKAELELLV